jgi:hypothetical protein
MLLSLAIMAAATPAAPAQVDLRAGTVITRSTRIRPGTYEIASKLQDQASQGAILIKGDNITVDFGGAELRGTPLDTEPNMRRGTAIEVRGRNVTIRNVKVRGYKNGLIAFDSPGLKIFDSDFSYNWKQRLQSTIEREDLSDWMSYHRNEKNEWLRYGAAIYLRNCNGFEVRNTQIHGGQNGLMLMECNKGLVWNNDFSFNSSLGLGMYLSSDNRIMHNKIDWNVRGYSHGRWNRGQDSAGILIYEQSHRNVFAYNSVTHGGDGFFLWAGQTTMDTGHGGCNDNLLYGNDFSHAPTNGIEATFSRNNFINNLILECWHGIWGGYSYGSRVMGNVFGLNAQAIAWEHGQNNLVQYNVFQRDTEGLHIWQNPTQDPNWGYPKMRDTRSRDWIIKDNLFADIPTNAFRIKDTLNVHIADNTFARTKNVVRLEGENLGVTIANNQIFGQEQALDAPGAKLFDNAFIHGVAEAGEPLPPVMHPSGNVIMGLDPETSRYLARFEVGWNPYTFPPGNEPVITEVRRFAPRPIRGGMNPFLKPGELRGRRYILVDEWGPYDFKSPLLWPRGEVAAASSVAIDADGKQTGPERTSVQRFEILGPPGKWRVVESGGANLSATEGQVPGFLDITLPPGQATNVKIELEYVGAETVDYRGIVTPAGQPVRLGYERFFAPIDWTVRFFKWERQVDPADPQSPPDPEHLREVLAGEPLRVHRTDTLDFASGGAFLPGLPADKFATVAEGNFEIDPGEYTLNVTTDDGVRVWVDDKLVIESWKHQGPTLYTADLKLGGKHRIRVEHFEITGYAALKVNLQPRR